MKNLKNLGIALSKAEQLTINGGKRQDCVTVKITEEIYGPYNGGVYASNTIYYSCDGGPTQTGPWHMY